MNEKIQMLIGVNINKHTILSKKNQ